ncbi:WG repeat-containing protein [Nostoc sp. FACHB-190]|uniref:WG repeat-containing protein n=1 Tax=Nostoc sp. FACHB-190 TaxID=2692838 RepID=UPI001685A86E|nr:WG repeat-containing protein [Nostoc sp. FACHB-190]MBD2302010.1 WG repeat-containing protein [Nostoc sp. FACHB-190]
MVFQKRTWLLVLFLLALVGAIAFHIDQVSQIEKLYPMSVLQKGYATKTENLYPVQFYMRGVRSGYAYINQAAQMVVEPQFKYAEEFAEGFAPVKVKDKWGFINIQGQITIPPQYDKVGESSSPYDDIDDDEWSSSSFSEGLAGIKLNRKWGFINQSGELVIPYQYDKVQKFSGGVATVQVNGLWGVINPEGKWIIQPIDKSPIKFFQGIAKTDLSVIDKSRLQIVYDPIIYYWDKSGQPVGNFDNPPLLAKEFQEELAIIEMWRRDFQPIVRTSEYSSFSWNKCGYQDKQGKIVIKPQFDRCQSFSQGLAAVRVDKKWGYIDKTGKFIVTPQFDYADSLFEDRGLVVSNGKIGFIDKTGKVIIKPEFDPNDSLYSSEDLKSKFEKYPQQIEPNEITKHRFSYGLAVVAKDNKCGYIDTTGQFAIQLQFYQCESFDRYGVARVYHNDYDGFYITHDGKIFPQMITTADFSKFYPARIKLLASVMACLLWIVAISFHEFGHAIVAYWGGDTSVKNKGYLSFDPRRYINPIHSIILPGIFLITGGIALPGAAVYIEFDQIRNRFWSSLTAAAGPIASILFGLLLVPIFHFSIAGNLPHWFSAFIAAFISLQFVIAVFNLLPIPPLDGYRIISFWLPSKLQGSNGIASLIGLLLVCFLLPFIPIAGLILFFPSAVATLLLGISAEFSLGGWYLFDRWYTALLLLVMGIVYLIYKPAFIFQLVGIVLEKFSPKVALKMYDRAIKIDPKSAFSWQRKALTLRQNVGVLGNYRKVVSAWEEAIKLDPHNRFSWQSLILAIRIVCIFDIIYVQKLIEAIERYTESYPKDAWGWGVKAVTFEELGNYEEALLAWEKNIKFDSSDKYQWRIEMKELSREKLISLGIIKSN